MYEETHWQAWAERERSRTDALRPVAATQTHRPSGFDLTAVEAIGRGVVELHRRNVGLCEQLLSHYGVVSRGSSRPTRQPRAAGRRPTDPRVDLAKRWVETWSREHAH